jgi:branched-chain amino acid transport system substrate-binding protein
MLCAATYLLKPKGISRRKVMSKGRMFLLCVVASFMIVGMGAGTSLAADEIRIGYVNGPASGMPFDYMYDYHRAIKLAVKQINDAGGVNGKSVNLIIEEYSGAPGALDALKKAVEQDHVLAVVGPAISGHVLAISDAVKSYAVPVTIGGTNATLTKRGNPWLFRLRPDDSITAAAMVKYIKEETSFTKVGILHLDTPFGTGGADVVEQYAKDKGLTIVKREKYNDGDKDYTTQLMSLKNAGAQITVFFASDYNTIALIYRQSRQLGSPYKFIGSPNCADPLTIQQSEGAAEGALAIVECMPGSSAANKAFAEAFKKEYGEDLSTVTAGYAYDALNILVNAIKKGGEDPNKIREAILSTQNYKGVLGTFSFSPNGDGLHEVSIVQITGGVLKFLKVVNVSTGS